MCVLMLDTYVLVRHCISHSFFFNHTATPEIYTYLHTLSLHDALPIWCSRSPRAASSTRPRTCRTRSSADTRACARSRSPPDSSSRVKTTQPSRSEEHTSELQSLMRNSYADFCLKKKKTTHQSTP